jgi:hypothetical protein
MTDYQIQASSRRCAATGRELQPGERFFSVLLEEGGRLVRKDYGADAWPGPPAGAFSFWAGKVPPAETRRRLTVDDELLLDCFQRLEEQTEPNHVRFRYVVSLLLMRRRRLRFEEARTEAGQEVLVLRCVRTGARHAVVNPCLTDDEMASVQDDVSRALGWE